MVYEFDIAISFAGEDRSVASEIAQKLKANGITVFYDAFEEATLLGADLYVHLHEVYSKRARYCVMLLSRHYAEKAWTNHERESAQERAFKERETYILPVRLDSTSIPGIRETVGYFSLREKHVDDLIKVLMRKLEKEVKVSESSNDFDVPMPRVRKSFTEREKDKFLEESFDTIKSFFKRGMQDLGKIEGVDTDLKEITSHKFICKVYSSGERISECTIWAGKPFSSESINYSNEANADAGGSFNESLSVEVGRDSLGLKPMMNYSGSNEVLVPKEAAEYLWSKLTEPLNR